MANRKNRNNDATENKFTNKISAWIGGIRVALIALLKVIYLLIFIGIFIFLMYSWNLDKADRIFSFLETSFWPIIILLVIFLFKTELSNLISKGVVIILPGGHELRFNEPAPQQETTQKNPEPKRIEDYKEIEKQYEEKIKELGKGQEELKTQLINAQIYLDFERIYRVIFGTQIDLLKRLRSIFPLGQPSKDTIFFFALTQRLFPVFANWTFAQYLNFLFTSNLIYYDNGSYFVTDRGKAFLAYIEILNYPKKDL